MKLCEVRRLILTCIAVAAVLAATGCANTEYGCFRRDYGETQRYHHEYDSGTDHLKKGERY